ncbi:probable purine permease 11 isoform X2 [Euphorbia lathyris]|uniref:probable purine permease 11 isoform X2 n=1 Tax=Euphorbia lathyris TaxID=212925 RepID=UPI0033137F80
MTDNQEPILNKDENTLAQSPFLKLKHWQWWLLAAINIFFLVVGQSAAVLLGRFYYDQGGNSKWLATLVQTAAFPILYIPLFLLPSNSNSSSTSSAFASIRTIALIYFFLGALIAGDNMLYSIGLLYLSASTYSLICASQLAFNAVFSYFINSQKFTSLIINSVVVLSFSSALIAFNDDSDNPSGHSKWKYILGFLCTLSASAIYSLVLSLMQLSFQKIIKKETFSVVLEMQIYTSLVATCISVIGLFASGEWRTLHGEMHGFSKGLIFLVSSLFSNVISTLALAVSPIAAVIIFHDHMNGVKVISLLMAFWGFGCYTYQNYIDDRKLRQSETTRGRHGSLC